MPSGIVITQPGIGSILLPSKTMQLLKVRSRILPKLLPKSQIVRAPNLLAILIGNCPNRTNMVGYIPILLRPGIPYPSIHPSQMLTQGIDVGLNLTGRYILFKDRFRTPKVDLFLVLLSAV